MPMPIIGNTFDPFFLILWERLLGLEGGETNDPTDRGGHTNHGVTEKSARAWGYEGSMSDFTKEMSRQFYWDVHWKPMRLTEIQEISKEIAERLFRAGVNCGVSRVSGWLQDSLNSFNREGKDYPDMAIDSAIGPVTINALGAFIQKRGLKGRKVLLFALTVHQGHHYLELMKRDRSQEKFGFGWFSERVVFDPNAGGGG